MILRYESWGAWIKLEKIAALVALDRDGVRALGFDGGRAWNEQSSHVSAPIELHLAVTSRCAAGCENCYMDAKPDGVEPPRETIERALDTLRDAGVFTVAFGGGEPTLRDDLGALAEAARARGISPVVTTSGLGINDKKLSDLARFAQVNVSYDGPSDAYATVRGFDGSRGAESTIRRLADAGVAVGVNVVLVRDTFDATEDTVRRARQLGAREVQLLRYKPGGRARNLEYLSKRLSPAQARTLGPLVRRLTETHGDAMRIRIDCALVPFLSADPTLASRPTELARWGVLGCEAGAALASARVDGKVAGCSFAPPTSLHVENLRSGWAHEEGLAAFRNYARAPSEPCNTCTLREVCRGGCKIVSDFTDGVIGPDPECPRVIDWRTA